MDAAPIGRRLKAARQLADITVEELASRLNLPGLGYKTIGNIERGDRDIRPHEVEPIARALGVPTAFLVGSENPAGILATETQLDRIERRLEAIENLLRTLVGEEPAEPVAFDPAVVQRVLHELQQQGLLRDGVLAG